MHVISYKEDERISEFRAKMKSPKWLFPINVIYLIKKLLIFVVIFKKAHVTKVGEPEIN